MVRTRFFPAVLVVTLLMFTYPRFVFSHALWINATDHSPVYFQKFGAQTKTYLGYGHRYPVDDFLPADNLAEYTLIGPDGGKTKINPANASGFLESVLRFKKPGQYVVAVATKPGFYTMYRESDTIHHKLGPKTGIKDVILSQYYEQYAKSLINVGDTKDKMYSQPIGHKLEIVLMDNLQELKRDGSHNMSVRILFDGRPASYCKVYATYGGFATNDDFACATTADGEGIARIRLSHWGPWLIKANVRAPAPDDMKDKCIELNYTATLTLQIP
jgi:uncharacterized GH25 family protein